jgi:hypothetical protein
VSLRPSLKSIVAFVCAAAWPLAAAAQNPPAPPAEPTPAEPTPAPAPEERRPAEPPPAAPEPVGEPATTPPPGAAAPVEPAPAALVAAAASGSNFMDTRLSFTCGSEDMLRDATQLPSAPGFHCGRPNGLGILFFDNYDTRYSGFETLSHLALYKHYDAGHKDLEAGMVIRFNEFSEDSVKLTDGGSYIRLGWYFDATRARKDGIALVAFPVSSDRMRLGYSYRISWGGSPEFFKGNPDAPNSVSKNPESTPGAKLQLDLGEAYAYVGVKSSTLLDPVINEKRSVLAYLGGAGLDVSDLLHVDVNGGAFDRGKNELEDVLGEPVWLYGGSLQIALHSGMPVGSSIDYALYRNSPDSIARLFKKEGYPGGLSWLLSAEATAIFQTLKDYEKSGSTKTQQGFAGDINGRVKWNYSRFKLDVMTRDVAFILHSIPSLPTYSNFPAEYKASPEIFASVGADQFFPALGLTAGATFGLDLPATLETPSASAIPGNMTTSTTLVVRNESDRTPLPAGEKAAPILALKGSAKLDLGEGFSVLGNLFFQYDANVVRYKRSSPDEQFQVEFGNFNQLGFDITLQARF